MRSVSAHMNVDTTGKRRPTSITVLSILLAWLAVGGFGNAVVWNLQNIQAAERQLQMYVGGRLFTVLALAYGVTALVTCVALWRMRSWAFRAYACWALISVLLGVNFALEGYASSVVIGLVYTVVAAAMLACGYVFIERKLQ